LSWEWLIKVWSIAFDRSLLKHLLIELYGRLTKKVTRDLLILQDAFGQAEVDSALRPADTVIVVLKSMAELEHNLSLGSIRKLRIV
jgi:hypothetical protein